MDSTNDPFADLPDDAKRAMLTAYRRALFAQLDTLVAVARAAETRRGANHSEPEDAARSAA